MPNSDQEIVEGSAQLEAICLCAPDCCFGQPALLGMPETIFVLFVRDELA
jgi:hypothetical protein